jgi:hypothetical protein
MTIDIKSLPASLLDLATQIQEETTKRDAIRESVLRSFGVTSPRALPHERLGEFNETLANALAEGKEIDIKIDTDSDKDDDDDDDDKKKDAKSDNSDNDDDNDDKSDDDSSEQDSDSDSDNDSDDKPKKKFPAFMKKKGGDKPNPFVKEETEQLDELSRGLVSRYLAKNKAMGPGSSKHEQRKKGYQMAKDKLSGKAKVNCKEQFEQLFKDRKGFLAEKAPLGSGERFRALSQKVGSDALAAYIGRKKFGKKKFSQLGHHKEETERPLD